MSLGISKVIFMISAYSLGYTQAYLESRRETYPRPAWATERSAAVAPPPLFVVSES